MIELVVSVCLLADPTKCKDVNLVFDAEGLTPMQCMMGAMPEIAKWVDAHPKWEMKRWTCQPAGKFAKL